MNMALGPQRNGVLAISRLILKYDGGKYKLDQDSVFHQILIFKHLMIEDFNDIARYIELIRKCINLETNNRTI